jgi:hypothetical protein
MKLRSTVTLLLLALALAGCRYSRVTDTQQFSISEPFGKLVVISQVGDIKISSGTGVAVTAETFASGCSENLAQQYLDQIEVSSKVDNNTCTITVKLPDNRPHFVTCGANLTITGIQGLPLDIDLDVGSIECGSMNGGTITNNVGDITVDAVLGDIQIATDTGTISVEDYSGSSFSLSTDAGNAGIHIGDNGTLDGSIKTGVGDISCEISKNRSTSAQLKTGVGGISITGITDFTKSGFVSLEASFDLGAADGRLTMETGTGDIEVSVF